MKNVKNKLLMLITFTGLALASATLHAQQGSSERSYSNAYQNYYGYTKTERVRDASELFVETFAENDAAQLARYYKRNGVLKLPNVPALAGRDAVQSAWQNGFDNGIQSVQLFITSLDEIGANKVLENGTYILDIETPNGIIQQEGTYSVLWAVPRKQHRMPKIIFDTIDAN